MGVRLGAKRWFLAGAPALLAAAWLSGPAAAASWLEKNFWLSGPRYDAKVPLCDHPNVLFKIGSYFAEKESRHWLSTLTILGIDQVQEVALRPWADNSIPRRYCRGVARISDGSRRPVHYAIIEDGGFIGWKWGVEWCITGLDRNWAYNPQCRMARP